MPDGGTVRISAEDFTINENDTEPRLHVKPGKYVRVSIQDEGIGISDENLPAKDKQLTHPIECQLRVAQ